MTDMTKNNTDRDFPDAAYDWMALLESGDITPEEYERYLDWRDADKTHAAAMAALQRDWAEITRLPVPKPAPHPGQQYTPDTAKKLFALLHDTLRPPVRRWGMALIAVLVLGGGIFTLYPLPDQDRTAQYATARAELRSVTLWDGSKVHLNAQSRITVAYSDQERRITLDQGEALFEVTSNPLRPFLVHAGDGRVQAVGTRFNVKLMPDFDVMVTLLEGAIRVTQDRNGGHSLSRLLNLPGAQAILRPNRPANSLSGAAALAEIPVIRQAGNPEETLLSWRRGKLIFQGQRLDSVLYEINRHSDHRILLKNPNAEDLPVYAVFNTGDWRGALSAIVKSYPVKAVQVSAHETHLVADDD